jgi:serine/threonine-protein kinase
LKEKPPKSFIFSVIQAAVVLFLALGVVGISAYFTLFFIIKREKTVTVPDLTGKSAVSVLETLTRLELNPRLKSQTFDDQIPKNHVIGQEPEAGTTIKKGRSIHIVISRGPRFLAAPDLTGETLSQAVIELEKNGLCRGNIAYDHYGENLEKNRIIAQEPLPGTILESGDCVNLLVNIGHLLRAYVMPDLSGQTLDEAVLTVEKYRLAMAGINYEYKKSRPLHKIVRQSPPAGYYVNENQPVKLTVNRKNKPPEGLYAKDLSSGGLFRYEVKPGYLNRRIRVEMDAFGLTIPLFDGYVKPGKKIWFIIPTGQDAIVRLYEFDELVEMKRF